MNRLHIRARENWYRDIWLLGVTALVWFAITGVEGNVAKIQEGRRAGTAVTCVVTGAILEGSHSFIIASATVALPKRLEARLEAEGYPSKARRVAQAEVQADRYTGAIQEAVERAVGKQGRGLIAVSVPKGRKGVPGHVNCERLRAISQIP